MSLLLPVDLILYILQLLPFKEAVRSSLLSKQFRDIGRLFPSVDLDLGGFDSDKAVTVVDAILACHSVPILNFSLRASSSTLGEARVESWLRVLSQRGIRGLSLASSQRPVFYPGDLPHPWVLPFPPALFSCTQLTSLKLRNFNFSGLHLQGFPNLVTLQLRACHIGPEYSHLVAHSPRLEDLSLINCSIASALRAPNLQRLHVCRCAYHVCACMGRTCLYTGTIIHEFRCLESVTPDRVLDFLVPLARESTKLRHVTVSEPRDRVLMHGLLHLVAGWSNVETICFGSTSILEKTLAPQKLPGSKTLDRLRELTLHMFNFKISNQVSFLTCIINSSPNLEKLILTGTIGACDLRHVIESTLKERTRPRTLRKLVTVELWNVFGCEWAEKLFLGFLMETAPSLETIAIEPFLTETDKAKLVDPIKLELERTKSQAKIAYLPRQQHEHHQLTDLMPR